MGMLDHWHPVCPGRTLKKQPVAVMVAGQRICLFRDSKRQVAAVDDVCPHRRLKLSFGKVVGDRIQCKYHGWTFDACGNGESPSSPKMHTCTQSFDTREQHGYIWVKSRQSQAEFPEINPEGWYSLGTFQHQIPAPLELTVDNFNEIEHSGTVHDTFGYDLEKLDQVKVQFEPTDTTVRVINVGPTKRLNPVLRTILGIGSDYLFHDDWTTHFSPVYSVFDHWWTTPDESREAWMRWRLYIFFVPIDEDTTQAVSFVYGQSRLPGPMGGLRIAKHFFRREVDREIRQDIEMLQHMASKDVTIDVMKLGRFDRVLGLTRERISRIYRGEAAKRIPVA
jgi:phenylpropionate dioxygenase-like ring-hydroxylating dioxygenase large terminal subunit